MGSGELRGAEPKPRKSGELVFLFKRALYKGYYKGYCKGFMI